MCIRDSVNAEHKLLPAGVEGEICITGDLVGKGYYQMQSEAFGSFMGERAYDTGDYGMLDVYKRQIQNSLWKNGFRVCSYHRMKALICCG